MNGKTIIVVGAGASREFGLPTGVGLKEEISRLLFCDAGPTGKVHFRNQSGHDIYIRLTMNCNDLGERHAYYVAARMISENMPIAPSIDNFLHTHKANEAVVSLGKAAIAHLIAKGEAMSTLYVDNGNTFNTLDLNKNVKTWISLLFTRLVAAQDFSAFKERIQSIKFVVFNYDRCIQQFIWFAVRSYFMLSKEEALDLVNSLDIVYVYGSIGGFEIGPLGHSTFGEARDAVDASKSIRTFTEGCQDDLQDSLAGDLDGADKIFFLGFGYLDLNLSALFGTRQFEIGRIYGTCKGMSANQVEYVKGKLAYHLLFRNREGYKLPFDANQLSLENMTCGDFISSFDRMF